MEFSQNAANTNVHGWHTKQIDYVQAFTLFVLHFLEKDMRTRSMFPSRSILHAHPHYPAASPESALDLFCKIVLQLNASGGRDECVFWNPL
jgi:hypothetical protein